MRSLKGSLSLCLALLMPAVSSVWSEEMVLIRGGGMEFYLDVKEVSIKDLQAFDPSFDPPYDYFDDPRQPATSVPFERAFAYCKSKGKRLPTSEEWHFACRGLEGREYSYGNNYDPNKARSGRRIWTDGPNPVGSFEKNEFGLYDMSGNVWEWADNGEPEGAMRAVHGGSWVDGPTKSRCASKQRAKPDLAAVNYGFRCARSLTVLDRQRLAEEEAAKVREAQAEIRREQARKKAEIEAKERSRRAKVEAEARRVREAEEAERRAAQEKAARREAALEKRVEGMVRIVPNAQDIFYIDPLEVSVGDYRSFDPSYVSDEFSGEDNRPATGVTFEQAQAYCRSKEKRLPTAAEWSAACLGSKGYIYSYGSIYDPSKARTGLAWYEGSAPVGTGAANEYGAKDMVGNVWEWVDGYYGKGSSYRAAYGGAWADDKENAKCTGETWIPSGHARSDLGFRCVVPLYDR